MFESSGVELRARLEDADLARVQASVQKESDRVAVFAGETHAAAMQVVLHRGRRDESEFFGVLLGEVQHVRPISRPGKGDAHTQKYVPGGAA